MTEFDKKIIMDFACDEITEHEFQVKYPEKTTENYISSLYGEAVSEKNGETLEYALMLSSLIKFPTDVILVLQEVFLQDWHKRHEEIARLFGKKMISDSNIPFIEKALHQNFEYMNEDDSREAFIVKCIYAIANCDSELSKTTISKLANSNDLLIREQAQSHLHIK